LAEQLQAERPYSEAAEAYKQAAQANPIEGSKLRVQQGVMLLNAGTVAKKANTISLIGSFLRAGVEARDITTVVNVDAQFLALQRPLFALYVLLSTRHSAFHRLCWLSHIKLRSSRSADLGDLRWYSIEHLAGVGYLLSANLMPHLDVCDPRVPLATKPHPLVKC
jgi:hypothetical protein